MAPAVKGATTKSLLLFAFLFAGLIQATESYHQLDVDPQRELIGEDNPNLVEYEGITWRFPDQPSADKFTADPEQYAPAYNGHCANALSLGRGLVPTDRTRLELFHDQLYLYFSGRSRDCWLDGGRKKADADLSLIHI